MPTFPLEFVKITTEPWMGDPSWLNIYAGGGDGGGGSGGGGSGGSGGGGTGSSCTSGSNCQSASNCLDTGPCTCIGGPDSASCLGTLCFG
jgi:hypothetical protein